MLLIKTLATIVLVAFFVSCNHQLPELNTSYAGSWRCIEERSLASKQIYVVRIDYVNNDSNTLLIRNVFNAGQNQFIVMRKVAANEFELLEQPGNGEIIRSLTGMAVPYRSISFNFIVFDGEKDTACNLTLTRD